MHLCGTVLSSQFIRPVTMKNIQSHSTGNRFNCGPARCLRPFSAQVAALLV